MLLWQWMLMVSTSDRLTWASDQRERPAVSLISHQDIITARQLVGSKMIIGVTVSSLAEAVTAVEAGADYLGIGTVYTTPT